MDITLAQLINHIYDNEAALAQERADRAVMQQDLDKARADLEEAEAARKKAIEQRDAAIRQRNVDAEKYQHTLKEQANHIQELRHRLGDDRDGGKL